MATFSAVVYSFMEDQRSVRPSDLLVLYFSASSLLSLPRLRSLWLISSDDTAKSLWTAIVILTAAAALAESIAKTRFLRPPYQHVTKEQSTGFWGQSLFTWLFPLLRLGYSKSIQVQDLYDVDEDLQGAAAGRKLQASWTKPRPHYALLRAACFAYSSPLLLGVLARLCVTAFTFCQPFLITATVNFMQQPETAESERYGQALIGAYVLVYVGIAVRFLGDRRNGGWLTAKQGIWSSVCATDIPRRHHDACWSGVYDLPANHFPESH